MTKELYFHGELPDGCRYTICGLVNDATPDVIILGAAVTSLSDNFIKKNGRELSRKRAWEGRKGSCTRSLSEFIKYVQTIPESKDWSRSAFINLVCRWQYVNKKKILKDFGLYH